MDYIYIHIHDWRGSPDMNLLHETICQVIGLPHTPFY